LLGCESLSLFYTPLAAIKPWQSGPSWPAKLAQFFTAADILRHLLMIGPRPAHLAFALDTDVLNDWRSKRLSTVQALSEYIGRVKAPPALTSMTVFEMHFGFENSAVISGGMTDRTKAETGRAVSDA
jgi:hypothetical protein